MYVKSLSNRLYLKKDLYQLRMDEGSDMSDHISEFNRFVPQLSSMDVKLEEIDQPTMFLSSLPKSYENLKTTLLVDDVMSALIDLSRVNGTSSSSQGKGLVVRKCQEIEDKKNGKKHMNNANVVEEDNKISYGDLYLVFLVEQQEGGASVSTHAGSSNDNSELWHKRLGHLSEEELHEQRTKSADESTDGSADEQSLEDLEKHPSDSWNLVRDRESRTKKPTQSTLFHALRFYRSPSLSLTALTDADWTGNFDDYHSTGGYTIFLDPNLVSWSAKKQPTIASSSTESEYHVVANTITELLWLQSVLRELGIILLKPPPSTAMTWVPPIADSIFHARTKHIEVDFHFIRDQVSKRRLQIRFIFTHDQISGILTFPLLASSTYTTSFKSAPAILQLEGAC
ncbi:hypothetical protein RJ640_021831 [Escallonia rubra]|uniref:Uncharacterized protein n=1 Tax=Escallonia rubra TaxID=112253 RepID=A0AA88RGL8_9ASTE|nr:hypothetical protein RJ640_021831 [Escallonia rubra]